MHIEKIKSGLLVVYTDQIWVISPTHRAGPGTHVGILLV